MLAPRNKVTRPRVYARLRPMFGRDAGKAELFTATPTSLEYRKDDGEICKYTFDRVFGVDAQQEDVFESIGDVALSSLRQGFNSTIIAYGQTGSGKTYSMEGAKDASGKYTSKGLIPRLFENVFKMFQSDPDIKSFEVAMQFVELYNEQLQDLLGKRKVVEVTSDPSGGYRSKDAVTHLCRSPEEAQHVYNKGCEMRATAATNMNEVSSRSHALLQLHVSWLDKKGKSFGVLNLVDLAGSEGMKKSGATGQNMKEGIKINLSLTKLALVVKCLAEGSAHIPFRESKLTMMLAKGLGGSNLLHIILALSNSRDQMAEGTSCLRFGQSCLSMTVNPNANKIEKEQAEMRAVIKEQMAEINELQSQNMELKRLLEEKTTAGKEVPDFMVAEYIAVNKDALREDIREQAQQIEELRAALEAKRREAALLKSDAESDGLADADDSLVGMDAQQRAEALEAREKQQMLQKVRHAAEVEQDVAAHEAELQQLMEIQRKLEEKLARSDEDRQMDERRIRAEMEEQAAAVRLEIEEKAAQMEAALRLAEQQEARREAERRKFEAELQEELRKKEETLRKEEELRRQMADASAAENEKLQRRMEELAAERAAQEAEIARANKETARLALVEAEAREARQAKERQEAELEAMRAQIKRMAEEQQQRADELQKLGPPGLQSGKSGFFGSYDPVPVMIRKVAKRHERAGNSGRKGDLKAVQRIIETLPVLSACNDLRALTELDPANRTLFQSLGGIRRMIDYLNPTGPQAPYATHVARTLPCVMDADARIIFHEYASGSDFDGQVRFKYLLTLLLSSDPDDKEHACLAIAAVAQESISNRSAFFEHGISSQVLQVLQECCRAQVPRQRLQRVTVLALSELAHDFEPFKSALRDAGGVPMLLALLTPSTDPFVIKETLQLLGRITQNNTGIQADLQQYNAVDVYSQLLFAQDLLHDVTISELAALALVNLVSEVPASLAAVERHPQYATIRFDLLASMARALTSSMLRSNEESQVLPGSESFRFWGHAVSGEWGETTSGGDRMHTSFPDNPQFLVRAPKGTNLCIVLQDTLEEKRQREKTKSRPLFLRLCVVEASRATLESRHKMLDINSSGWRHANVDGEGAVVLEPGVLGSVNVAKTREVVMRCTIRSCGPESAWVIVPHVGCQHQHSQFALTVFADQQVSIEGELLPWQRRVISSSWSPLCSSPNSIADIAWRNSPQFQLINMGASRSPVHAMLSYAERDDELSKRHLQPVDKGPALGASSSPTIALYVMKANLPDKRFVGALSPQVENYVSHSLVTNSWCVQTKWDLDPGDVYALIAVMSESPKHQVPLRLTIYYPPELEFASIVAKPLSTSAEYYCSVVKGATDDTGCAKLDLTPQESGSVQATLVVDAMGNDAVFCSIATYSSDGVLHKQTSTFSQRSAVLTTAFPAGSGSYSMKAKFITQRQDPVRGQQIRILLYSTRPMQASAAVGQKLALDYEASNSFVSRSTAGAIDYGEEVSAEHALASVRAHKEDEAELDASPAVIYEVMNELEQQRDTLYSFTRSQLNDEPPAILESLRRQNEELRREQQTLQEDLAKAQAELASRVPNTPRMPPPPAEARPPPISKLVETNGKSSAGVDKKAVEEMKAKTAQLMQEIDSLRGQLLSKDTEIQAERARAQRAADEKQLAIEQANAAIQQRQHADQVQQKAMPPPPSNVTTSDADARIADIQAMLQRQQEALKLAEALEQKVQNVEAENARLRAQPARPPPPPSSSACVVQ
mmetsp:Transcript_8106/g.20105  ORF Transcript_8106/g.20105 Transcript_8106/m.20105 type:complete len:1749 (-) Transcript_8106:113-5359(-)